MFNLFMVLLSLDLMGERMGIIHRLMDDHCFFIVVHFRKGCRIFRRSRGAGFLCLSHLLVREGVTVIHHLMRRGG
ncbi:hypothetical protein GWX73_14095 [Salmonella enterica]|uniref:Uncharacterized protein n=2 Tax=Salmonella enterica subsp. enterica serovar Choleraesuis TaxID=119912 RepID=Q57S07_SALCH|nr:hypothetical protein SCH_0598 [Salmonella enterica subsp. enterica serovar Choleraesuis str. SC-B67]EEH5113786.1 hypothetical protein [Salmonella enterica subsp. enterica serovar Kunzendorf]EFZ05203.1 hypothetical protein SCA50_0642 [Salmonella enterica subsp. enterica serovar Choleraesuis str. SCSA50]